MANSDPTPVTMARLRGAASMPTRSFTFSANDTSSGARKSSDPPCTRAAYRVMNRHPTRAARGASRAAVWPSLGEREPDRAALREVVPSTEVWSALDGDWSPLLVASHAGMTIDRPPSRGRPDADSGGRSRWPSPAGCGSSMNPRRRSRQWAERTGLDQRRSRACGCRSAYASTARLVAGRERRWWMLWCRPSCLLPRPRRALVPRPRLTDVAVTGPATQRWSSCQHLPGSARRRCWRQRSRTVAEGHDGTSVAWVSLDARDGDAARFWTYVLQRSRRRQPGVRDAPPWPAGRGSWSLRGRRGTSLVNELERPP